jgi:hypothetical protein
MKFPRTPRVATAVLVILVVAVVFSSCASQQEKYERNLKQARISNNIGLPQIEINEIIRTVSRESMFPIL